MRPCVGRHPHQRGFGSTPMHRETERRDLQPSLSLGSIHASALFGLCNFGRDAGRGDASTRADTARSFHRILRLADNEGSLTGLTFPVGALLGASDVIFYREYGRRYWPRRDASTIEFFSVDLPKSFSFRVSG